MTIDPRTPVLVGVGTAATATEASELMTLAARAAGEDAGTTRLLARVDRIAVPKGTWSYADPGRLVAGAIGAPRARTHVGEIGISQQTLVSQAMRAILEGSSAVALVVGGEARAWARGDGAVETEQSGVVPDVIETREPEFFAQPEVVAGILVPPVQQYAMIERALAAHEGRSGPELRADVDGLWERFNLVARTNPDAAFPAPKSASELGTPSPSNRPLALPYNRWHASQWTVDQAAALLLCSAAVAREVGVPRDRWIFPFVSIDANHSVSLSRRRLLHRWPAMAVLGRAATERLGRPLSEIDVTEVYSCFPSAVRVQQRELGLPADGTPTVTGGMAFAGGPFNNFVYQATAAVVRRLRDERGPALGMVTTVSGLLTKPGLAVWSTEPDGVPPLLDDFAVAAAAATPSIPVLDEHDGPAHVATYTVTYDRTRPARVAVIADVEGGAARCVAVCEDEELAARVAAVDTFVGERIVVRGVRFSAD